MALASRGLMKTFIVRLLLTLTLLLIVTQLPTRAASIERRRADRARRAHPTNVCGTIITNTTWSLINSPYDVCIGGVTIMPAATLTIQPGVTVRFQSAANNNLNVMGALSAIGTLTQPITFTGVVATPGSWGGLSANNTALAPALVNLNYVTLDYGGIITGSYRGAALC